MQVKTKPVMCDEPAEEATIKEPHAEIQKPKARATRCPKAVPEAPCEEKSLKYLRKNTGVRRKIFQDLPEEEAFDEPKARAKRRTKAEMVAAKAEKI